MKENDQNSGNQPSNTRCDCHSFSDTEVGELRAKLLAWYSSSARTLPWRSATQAGHPSYLQDGDRRGYSTLVSEVMLQQTQVATVADYYTRWMARWPTVQDLAQASLEQVQEAWSGLGYYSRGRRLHEAAVHVVSRLEGRLPTTAHTLLRLAGVGRYTAGAVASIAYGQVTGLVDGNVMRVLARMRQVGALVEDKEVVEAIWRLAETLVDPDRPGDFNQAVMELGATVCSPRSPSCTDCPVRSLCAAHTSPPLGDIEDCALCLSSKEFQPSLGVTNWPRKKRKKESRVCSTLVAVVRRGTEWAMVRRPSSGLLANLLEFPSVECEEAGKGVEDSTRDRASLKDLLDCLGISIRGPLKRVGEVIHVFSHINMTYIVHCGETIKEDNGEAKLESKETEKLQWLSEEEFEGCGTSTAMRKVYKFAVSSTSTNTKKRKLETDSKQNSISSFFTKIK